MVQRRFRTQSDTISLEVPVQREHEHHGHRFVISGRMDLCVRSPEETRVIEIKSCSSPIAMKRMVERDALHPHRLQAALYAHLAAQEGQKTTATLMYVSTQAGATHWVDVDQNCDETVQLLNDLLDCHLSSCQLRRLKQRKHRSSAESLRFPYETKRSSQSLLMERLSVGFKKKPALLVHAPTGSGKTVSTLFPALQSCFKDSRTLIFGTAKNAQKIAATKTLKDIAHAGNPTSAVVLASRESLCISKENPVCKPSLCCFAKGYYEKLRKSRLQQVALKGIVFDAPLLKKLGQHYEICPFELALDLSLTTDTTVCDYNHIVSPQAQIARHFAEPKRRAQIRLIVDEAHNFPERVRSEHSPKLSSEGPHTDSRHARRYFERYSHAITEFVEKFAPEHERTQSDKSPQSWKTHVLLEQLGGACHEALFQKLQLAYGKYTAIVEFPQHTDPVLKAHQNFLALSELLSQHEIGTNKAHSLIVGQERNNTFIQVLCKDSALHLKSLFEPMEAPLFMSATLTPADHYARSLGFSPQQWSLIESPSPFDREKRKLFIVPQVTTRFTHRHRHIPKISHCLSRILGAQPVNTFIFFPSFEFAKQVYEQAKIPGPFQPTLQKPQQKKEETDRILQLFQKEAKPQVLFGVHGGSFSEGVDLPGSALESVILVGPALPRVSLELDLLQKYESQKGQNGFDIVSVVPSMAKANQAIGRLIRSHRDRGTCFLLDARYTERAFFQRLDSEWAEASPHLHLSQNLLSDIEDFWNNSKKGENFKKGPLPA